MSEVEVEREQYAVPVAGDRVRVELIATKTDRESRMRKGILSDMYSGVALVDLHEGKQFRIDLGHDGIFYTSEVMRVGKGMFTTKNSSYSFEVFP